MLAFGKTRLGWFGAEVGGDKLIGQGWMLSQVTTDLPGEVGFAVAKMRRHQIEYAAHAPAVCGTLDDNIMLFIILQHNARLIGSMQRMRNTLKH